MNPRITIGVCVRNCEKTIKDTIESIVVQSYPQKYMELIIVDDGSTDDTLNIVNDNINRKNIDDKIFCNRWKGIGEYRNIVVNNAGGKYIVWVDGDMILLHNYIKKLVNFMEIN